MRGIPNSTNNWLHLNGKKLRSAKNEEWVCFHTVPQKEFFIAEECANKRAPFFLPLVVGNKIQDLKPLWSCYIFCRGSTKTIYSIRNRADINRILKPTNEVELLKHLSKFGPYNKLVYNFDIGDDVEILTGKFTLQGQVTNNNLLNNELAVSARILDRFILMSVKETNLRPVRPSAHLRFKVIESVRKPKYILYEAPEKKLEVEIHAVNNELMHYLAKHPELLYDVSPRKFELIIAEIVSDMGYEVHLTPETKDGGRDILAVFKIPHMEILTIIECKRYAPDNPIGVNLVERFLWVLDRKDNASCGLIATTSYFSPEASEWEKKFKWRLALKNFEGIKEWLNQYGKWSKSKDYGLWLPSSPLVQENDLDRINSDLDEFIPII